MARSQNSFYIVLAAVGIGGAVFLVTRMRGGNVSIPANVVVTAADTTGFRGYLLGSPTAPVEIVEYADFQCPICASFEVLSFADMKTRLIDTGKARFRFRDYPLDQPHRYTRIAAHAGACANDQGKFWTMKDGLFHGQNDWAFSRNPMSVMKRIATTAGLDAGAWETCMKSAKHAGRIQASLEEGQRLGVGSTPTFLIGGRLYSGVMAGDVMVRLVDSLAATAAGRQGGPVVPIRGE